VRDKLYNQNVQEVFHGPWLLQMNLIFRLTVVVYGCETWSLTLREEQRLRVFENRVLRRILGPRRDGVTGDWRKLHNEELHNLYSSPNIIRMVKSSKIRLSLCLIKHYAMKAYGAVDI
jgi:hypothetical protein